MRNEETRNNQRRTTNTLPWYCNTMRYYYQITMHHHLCSKGKNTKNITFQESFWLFISILAIATTSSLATTSASSSFSPSSPLPAAFTNKITMFQRIASRGKTTNTAAAAAVAKEAMVPTTAKKPKVAVIGAGAAGLVTARILSSRGFQPFIFEKEKQEQGTSTDGATYNGIGGVWAYEPNSKLKPMYRGLRTNLPRELMAFREKKWGGDGTSMSFVTHKDVKNYLKEYAAEHGLEQYISFGCEVKQLTVCSDGSAGVETNNSCGDDSDSFLPWPKVKLEWQNGQNDTFDAVCICNGHYSVPSSPPIEGLQHFKGTIMHSIEYDDPSIFKDQTVLCIGGRASGSDLAREISMHAKKVYLSDTSCPLAENGEEGDGSGEKRGITMENVVWVPKTLSFDEKDSSIQFDLLCTDRPKDIDVIIFCSGYDYSFPFINDSSNLDLRVVPGERRVAPLYEQLWHAQYPNIAFVGLQHSVVPFPFFEFQAEAISTQLLKMMKVTDAIDANDSNDEFQIPFSLEERMIAAEVDANSGGPNETKRVQDTHYLGSYQWDACRVYAKYGGILNPTIEKYINTNRKIYQDSNSCRKGLFPGGPDDYRYNSYVRDDENESFNRYPITMDDDDLASSRGTEILLNEI